MSERTVWTTMRRRGGHVCLHTDRECGRLSTARNIYERRRALEDLGLSPLGERAQHDRAEEEHR